MSYARWSNSAWYAFYNVNGKLSLWYDMDHTIDLEYEDLMEFKQYEDEALITQLILVYECTRDEAIEAIQYINQYLEDYDPKDGEEYQKELDEFMTKLENLDDK
jgi:predicted RecB family endonuclease